MGIGDREQATVSPEDKDAKIANVYPWGSAWPPPDGAGNYSGQENAAFKKIAGYRDQHPFTAPVGSYTANRYGLHDLGGNVWERCEDQWSPGSASRVLRGGSWFDYYRDRLLSSYRSRNPPDARNGDFGFRVVLGEESER